MLGVPLTAPGSVVEVHNQTQLLGDEDRQGGVNIFHRGINAGLVQKLAVLVVILEFQVSGHRLLRAAANV